MILDLYGLFTKYKCFFNGVLHIGAHYGDEYTVYKNLNISPIVFIEAIPDTYKVLTQRVGPECICISTALGNTEGQITMHLSSHDQCTSVLEPGTHLEMYPNITFNGTVTVNITRVDSLNIPKCNFINLDVQGYELEVLKGAKEYLKTVDYVMTEVNRDQVYKNCAQIEELDSYLADYGLKRVEVNWLGETWGDAFYIKS